ncbi:MAG: hypothetical protein QXT13_09575 [Pyrobaculum sp.]
MDKLTCLAEAVEFLKKLWSYESEDARCFAIVDIGAKTYYRHFCRDGGDIYDAVERHLDALLEADVNIYHQVLPLSRKPERGRGSAADVKVGKWLWADLDYKREVESAEFEGCREYDDYALECFYTERGKTIYVKRPRLSEALEDVRKKIGEPSIVVDSGAGYHFYFKLSREVDAETLKRLEAWVVDTLGADRHSKDLARILRLPCSVNQRVNRLARVIYVSDAVYDPDELLKRMSTKTQSEPQQQRRHDAGLRELSEAEILKIVELLKDAYRPGNRQFISLYLAGWLAKANISPVSAARVIKALMEATGDEDPPASRISTIAYSYRKAGIDISTFVDEIARTTGVRPYGVGAPLEDVAVKGKTGLQEILEEALGEQRALAIIHELTEILNASSPHVGDSVIELLNYEKQLYAVANLRRLIMAKAKRKGNELIYRDRIAVVAPTQVIVYENPLGGIRKYEIRFEGKTLSRPLVIGPATLDEIANRLVTEGFVYNRRQIHDVLSAVIQGFVLRRRAQIRTEIESPGFYYLDGKVTAVKFDMSKPSNDELRTALTTLNELALIWFRHAAERFAVVVKWGAVAPFGYILKQKGTWLPQLYLYGAPGTGKTTLGRIVLRMWGLDSRYEKTGASIDTVPRLGHVLSESTFPVLINEPGGALMRDEVVESLKNAIDGLTVRGKFIQGQYVPLPALASLIFTSNRHWPQDTALRRRLRIISFSYAERITEEKWKAFETEMVPRLEALRAIGKCIASIVAADPSLLDGVTDPLQLGETLLTRCYEIADMPAPQWLAYDYVEKEDIYDDVRDEFLRRLVNIVNNYYTRYIDRVSVTNIVDRLVALANHQLLPGVYIKDTKIVITPQLIKELQLDRDFPDASLKSLAEMFEFEYKLERIGSRVVRAAVVDIDKLSEILSTEVKDYENNEDEEEV